MIRIYEGFEYNYGSLENPIFDVIKIRPYLYHSVCSAKKDKAWIEKDKLAKENPEKYHTTPFNIASDKYGKPFIFGDAMLGMFNMEIIEVKVIG